MIKGPLHDKQHGFHNDTTPRYDEEAAKLAWSRRSKRKVNRDNSRFVSRAETREQSSSLTD
jgi:dienelactone hydrolase